MRNLYSHYLKILCLMMLFIFIPTRNILAQTSDQPGFYVEGRHLYDRFGNKVILVGVNKMVIWTDRDGIPAFTEIAKTGANVVRIVWLTEGTAEELDIAITNAYNHMLIPMVDCHDSTGKWNLLPTCVDYWVRPDIAKVLKKHEAYLLVNIANEAGEGIVSEWEFRAAYELAVKRIRHAGLRVPLIIDAQGYGQNINDLQKNGPYLIKADPEHNVMFSIHMWWPTAWRGAGVKQMVIDEIAESVEMELPLIVGEFANKGPGCSCCIPYETIIEQSHLNEVGFLPWSWGPGNGDCDEMDMTEDGRFETLHGWGLEVAVTSTHSIQAIAVRPDWIVNATPIPTPTPFPSPIPQPAPDGLISQGKPVTVSSVEGEHLPGEAAVDGRLTTRWSSEYSDPQEIIIDLGQSMDIGRIVLEWETAYGKEYTLDVSEDGETWVEIVYEKSSDGGRDDHIVTAQGRYIRLQGIKRGTEWGYSLYEFWVFDSPDAPLPELSDTQEVMEKPDLRPDLVITEISWLPENVIPGANVVLHAVVENQGRAAVLDDISVTWSTGGTIVGHAISDKALAPGASITIESQQSWQPESSGGFVMLAQVDGHQGIPDGNVNETKEYNNMQATYGFVKPDNADEATVTATPFLMVSPTALSQTPTSEPTVGDELAKPEYGKRWTWLPILAVALVCTALLVFILQKRRR